MTDEPRRSCQLAGTQLPAVFSPYCTVNSGRGLVHFACSLVFHTCVQQLQSFPTHRPSAATGRPILSLYPCMSSAASAPALLERVELALCFGVNWKSAGVLPRSISLSTSPPPPRHAPPPPPREHDGVHVPESRGWLAA